MMTQCDSTEVNDTFPRDFRSVTTRPTCLSSQPGACLPGGPVSQVGHRKAALGLASVKEQDRWKQGAPQHFMGSSVLAPSSYRWESCSQGRCPPSPDLSPVRLEESLDFSNPSSHSRDGIMCTVLLWCERVSTAWTPGCRFTTAPRLPQHRALVNVSI